MTPHIVWTAHQETTDLWSVSATFRGSTGAISTVTARLGGEWRQVVAYLPTQIQNMTRACAARYQAGEDEHADS